MKGCITRDVLNYFKVVFSIFVSFQIKILRFPFVVLMIFY